MAATTLGTTGNWGIPNDQAGLLITELSFDFSNEQKEVLDKGGEVIGLAFHKEKVEIKMSGLVSRNSAFSGKIGTALALANAMPNHLQNSGGTTVLMQVNRTMSNEDFEKIDLTATHFPFVESGVSA